MTQFLRPGEVDHDAPNPLVESVIVPRARDLGGFSVRRALPSAQRQMVGPFIFWDQMGPAVFKAGEGIDVRPHPHIGLATLTYLFEGQILHRDSLGSVQPIDPGEVNWMTAGRGIVHSERTAAEVRRSEAPLFGIQSWIALPAQHEETEPGFAHHPAGDLPSVTDGGLTLRVIAGSLHGLSSPVRTFSDMVYADAVLQPGSVLEVPATYDERAIYIASGSVCIGEDVFDAGRLVVLAKDPVAVRALTRSRILVLGGEPMDGPRYIWWNFVSRSRDRIEAAKADWRAGRFEAVPGESEWIPLPD
ncbi:MAG: pirin family protein [Alsobacter sp.]